MKTRIFFIFAAFLLSSCAAKFDANQAGPYPDNYKEIIAEHIKQTHYDPYSMRDVYISRPHPGTFALAQWYYVCVQKNAKNRMGGYVGLRREAYLININGVILNFDDYPNCRNGGVYAATLEPWPEMEMAGDK